MKTASEQEIVAIRKWLRKKLPILPFRIEVVPSYVEIKVLVKGGFDFGLAENLVGIGMDAIQEFPHLSIEVGQWPVAGKDEVSDAEQ